MNTNTEFCCMKTNVAQKAEAKLAIYGLNFYRINFLNNQDFIKHFNHKCLQKLSDNIQLQSQFTDSNQYKKS